MAPKNKKLKLFENFYLKLKYSRELGNYNLVLTFLNTKWLSFNFEPDQLELEFIAGSNITGREHEFVMERSGVELKTWNDIRVIRTDNEIKFFIKRKSIGRLTDVNRPLLLDVTINISDKFHQPANAIIKGLTFCPYEKRDLVPHSGFLQDILRNSTNNFFLSFKLYPCGVVSKWSSII